MEPQACWTLVGSLVWLFRLYLVPQLPGMLQAKRGLRCPLRYQTFV